ncbi:MAG: 1-deoxy-D-xylulose-5-phosphate synthase [Planctomycetes bacterium]|nr:1-deoxy-D-xylulose-5-phosphate synthase [Planctomycetota bacterium]
MAGLLQSIRNPRDLRQVAVGRLPHLAREVQDRIRRRFALKDAYLRSALGTADLTLALHYVFDFSHDRLFFDLAHQAAAHLVLTRGIGADGGTMEERPQVIAPGDERDPYDLPLTLHPGSAVSRALGFAARAESGRKVVAVIGDGSVVSGVALEALNNGHGLDSNVLVILNDNEMSVSKVVGAMGEYLAKIRAGKTYNELKRDAHKLLQSIPIIGSSLDKAAEQLKDAVARALVPGSIFEKLGPRYFGPVDGHNIAHLVQLLSEIKGSEGFNLLHVITRREGEQPEDEEEPELVFPSIGLEVGDGEVGEGSLSGLEHERQGEDAWNDVLGESLLEAARADRDLRLVLLAAPDMSGLGAAASRFAAEIPDRVHDMQLNEQHGVAFAAGLARSGLKPVIIAPASVLPRAHDQLFQEIALNGAPAVVIAGYAGLVDARSGLYHGCQDLALLGSLPGFDLLAPRDGRELRQMLALALDQKGPSAIRVPQGFAPDPDRLYELRAELARGRPEVLRGGTDLSIWALGSLVYPAMDAAEHLAQKGLEASVVNVRYVRPLDLDLLRAQLDGHTLLFSVEEHGETGGLGQTLLGAAARLRLGAGKIIPIAVPDGPVSRASRARLLTRMGLDAQGLADRILHDYRRHVRSPSR